MGGSWSLGRVWLCCPAINNGPGGVPASSVETATRNDAPGKDSIVSTRFAVVIGLDVGKSGHHACALYLDGGEAVRLASPAGRGHIARPLHGASGPRRSEGAAVRSDPFPARSRGLLRAQTRRRQTPQRRHDLPGPTPLQRHLRHAPRRHLLPAPNHRTNRSRGQTRNIGTPPG